MSLFDFISEHSKDVERRNRIRLAVAAYAYEFDNSAIMSDGEFDSLSKKIVPAMSTVESYHDRVTSRRFEILDKFWEREFDPSTGMWIHRHPELGKIKELYEKYYKNMC